MVPSLLKVGRREMEGRGFYAFLRRLVLGGANLRVL